MKTALALLGAVGGAFAVSYIASKVNYDGNVTARVPAGLPQMAVAGLPAALGAVVGWAIVTGSHSKIAGVVPVPSK